MKVTGWTYYENPKFEDVDDEITGLKSELIKNVKFSFDDVRNKTDDEVYSILEERNNQLENALNNAKLKELTDLLDGIKKIVIKSIRENGYIFDGATHQNADYGCPVIDNKYIFSTTQRSWGQIMSEAYYDKDFIINNEVLDEALRYIYLAWDIPANEVLKIPDESLWVK